MDQIVIEPLRAVKLTHTQESVLITKEDHLTQEEWEKLKTKVEKIAKAYREPFEVDVEIVAVLGKTYVSVKDCPSLEPTHFLIGKMAMKQILGNEENSEETWEELAKILEVELQIEGYSVKRTEPEKDDYISKRRAAGNPVPAKILVEDDCITIGVTDIFRPELPTIDIGSVLKDVNDATRAINKMLQLLHDCWLPEMWKDRTDKKPVCTMGHTVSGAYIYGVAEMKVKAFKPEELIIAARAAKNVLELKGYKVEAERLVKAVTKLDL